MVQIQYFDSVEEIVARYGDSIPSNIICVAGNNTSVMLNSGNNNPHQEEEEEQQQIQIFTIKNQDLNVDPTEETLVLTADEGYTGLGTVTISGIQASRLIEAITTNGEYHFSPEEGHYYTGIDIEVDVQPALEDKVVAPSTSQQIIGATEGYYGLNSVTIEAVDATIDPDITAENIRLGVNVLGIEGTCNPNPALVSKTVDPSTSSQTVEAGSNYYGLQTVTVRAVTSAIDSNISADNIKEGVTILGVTGTLTSGGITPSGSYEITSNGTYDITEYAAVEVSVPTEGGDVDEIYEALEEINVGEVIVPSGTFVVPIGVKFCKSSVSSFPSDWDWSNVQSWDYMFGDCTNLTTVPDIDLSSPWAFNLDGLFNYCSSLISIPTLSLDTVGQMGGMFQGCTSLATFPTLDFSNNPSTSIYASCLFSSCSSLASVPDCDFSKFSDASGLFSDCSSLATVGDLNFGETSCSQLFYHCSNLTTVGTLYTQDSTDMYGIFESCSNLTSVAGIDFSSLTSAPDGYFEWSDHSNLTHFIVNGVINWSWSSDEKNGGFFHTPNLDFASIKSILEAMNRTTNTDAKKMSFNNTIADQNGELATLITSCEAKGWTVEGLYLTTEA